MEDLGDALIMARDAASSDSRNELDREVRAGRLTRVTTGVYVSTDVWSVLDGRQRHLVIAHAARALRRRRLVFSHWTAIAAWDLPIPGDFPDSAHARAVAASGGRTDERLVRHCVGIPEVTHRREGLEVTPVAMSVADLARVAPFATSVVAADAALRRYPELVSLAALAEEAGRPGRRGAARARRVALFADPLSGSPGESVSRTSMALAGIPAPILQFRFDDREGAMFVDFWWPQFDLVGEFDGRVKYDDPRYLAGRSPREVLWEEKHREDRIRALGPRVTRWGWDVAASPRRLRAHLVAAGIRPERYRNW